LAAADDVISNSGTVADLRQQVTKLHAKYLGLARSVH
jgi:dephospho-CoA kinase